MEKSSSNRSNDSTKIKVSLKKLSKQKKNQIKQIKKLINQFHAYSNFHYSKAKSWKFIYWFGGIGSVVLSGIGTIIDAIFNQCDDQMFVRNYNVILGTVVTIGLSIITFLNANDNRRNNEEAGDKYKQLSLDLFRETCLMNTSIRKINLERVIETYSIRFGDYIEAFYEPPQRKIIELMKIQEDSKDTLSIKFV